MTGKTASKTAMKAAAAKDDAVKKRTRRSGTYESYIHAVLDKLNEGRPTKKSMAKSARIVMNDLCENIFHQVGREAMRLCKRDGRKKLSPRDVAGAWAVILPPSAEKDASRHLIVHINNFATNAVNKYLETKPKAKPKV